MLGREWRVADAFAETPDADLARMTVTVAPEQTPDAPLVTLTGYLPTADLPEVTP